MIQEAKKLSKVTHCLEVLKQDSTLALSLYSLSSQGHVHPFTDYSADIHLASDTV